MISFQLKNGVEVIPTSFHGSRFNDGTVFTPSDADIAQIKNDWGTVLRVQREFSPVEIPLNGIAASSSSQNLSQEGLTFLERVMKDHSNAIILVSFMVVSALREMGVRDKYPRVLAANATPETSRAKPDEKVWDINNFAY